MRNRPVIRPMSARDRPHPDPEWLLVWAQPLLFAIGVVLQRWYDFAASSEALPRPLLIAAVAAVLMTAVAWLTTRSAIWGPVIASLAVLMLLGQSLPAAVLAAVVVWWLAVRALRRRAHSPPPPLVIPRLATRAAAYFSLAFAALMVVQWWAVSTDVPVAKTPHLHVAASMGGPNVYLVLLDGYPRADTLRETFAFDNSPFLASLRELGFQVKPDALSNYNKTWLTLASMLNGSYVDDLLATEEAWPNDPRIELRWLHSLIKRATMLDLFRASGYSVETIVPPFTTAELDTADVVHDSGYLNEFEIQLVRSSPISRLIPETIGRALVQNHEQRIRDSLMELAEISQNATGMPRIVIAHIHSPHTPFALPDGGSGEAAVPKCFPETCSLSNSTMEDLGLQFEEFRGPFLAQLQELNSELLIAIDEVVSADPEAVIVLFSDHGARYSLRDLDEHFRILMATRSRGVRDLLGEDASPVNILRVIVDTYLGREVAPLPYEGWLGDWLTYLEVRRYVPAALPKDGA